MNELEKDSLIEQLAEIEHQRWASWQEWCHKVIRINNPSKETLKVLERWDKQIATPYKDLLREEQLSDIEQVMRYYPIIQAEKVKEIEQLLFFMSHRTKDDTCLNEIELVIKYRINELRSNK